MKKIYFILILKSFNSNSFYTYSHSLRKLLSKLGVEYTQFYLPINKKRVTFLKSPFVNKRAREQFEIKFYKIIIQIKSNINLSILGILLINKPSTIQVKIKTL